MGGTPSFAPPDPTQIPDPTQQWPTGALADQSQQNDALQQQADALLQQQQQPPDVSQTGWQQPQLDMSHPNNIEAAAAGVHHERLARMLSKVGDVLGGGTSYSLKENPDGTVDVAPHPATAGEKWGRVAQAALEGMAHGWAAGQGPGGMGRALAAGVDTGTQLAAQRQAQARDLSQQYTNQNRQKMLFDANMKLMTLNTAKAAYSLDHEKQQDVNTSDDRTNAMNDHLAAIHGTQHVFDTQEDLAHAYNDPSTGLADAENEHRVNVFHTPTPDNPNRITINVTPKDQMKQLYQPNWTPMRTKFDPTNLKRGVWQEPDEEVIGGHNTVEEHNAAVQKVENDNMNMKTQYEAALRQQQEDKLKTQQVQAQMAASQASAELTKEKTQILKQTAMTGGAADPASTPPDPNFPSRQYFPPGEPGIQPYDNPKNRTYKIDRDTETRENSAFNLQHNYQELQNIFGVDVNGNPTKQLTGGIAQAIRDKSATELLGLKDSHEDTDLSRMIHAVDAIGQASTAMHGRNAPLTRDNIKQTLNNYLNSPAAMLAGIDQDSRSAQDFIDVAAQRRAYGGVVPESRRHGVADQWWASRGGTIVDRGSPTREATIQLVLPGGFKWQGSQSAATQILKDNALQRVAKSGALQE